MKTPVKICYEVLEKGYFLLNNIKVKIKQFILEMTFQNFKEIFYLELQWKTQTTSGK